MLVLTARSDNPPLSAEILLCQPLTRGNPVGANEPDRNIQAARRVSVCMGDIALRGPADPGNPMPRKRTISSDYEQNVLCHLDVVYRMAIKLSGDAHEAEDLVQETFLRAHRAFDKFELREYGAKPWLLKILHNVFYTRCGSVGRAPSLVDDLSLDDLAAELEHAPSHLPDTGDVDWDQFDEDLKAAVMSLPPEYRTVLLLWALGDLSYKEIAAVMGCALGTVMSRLFRARQQVGEQLGTIADRRGCRPSSERESL